MPYTLWSIATRQDRLYRPSRMWMRMSHDKRGRCERTRWLVGGDRAIGMYMVETVLGFGFGGKPWWWFKGEDVLDAKAL